MDYTTLIFDAFDTVVHINNAKLPTCRVNGQAVQTTAPAVYETYVQQFGKLDFDVFYRAFSQSSAEVKELRRTELREIRNQERFRVLLRMLGQDADHAEPALLDSLTMAHMDQLQQTFEVRPETLEVLDWAAGRFRRAMISNFDYAPALYTALDRFGIRSAFEAVSVSVEVGWRKPHPIIFERTFDQLSIRPSEALFIGDQLYVDVYGAIQSGMDVVWLETQQQDWAIDGLPEPTFKVRSITEVIGLLEKKS